MKMNINLNRCRNAILRLNSCLEGALSDRVKQLMKEKTDAYGRMPLQNIEQIFAVVDANVPTPFVFDRRDFLVAKDFLQNTQFISALQNIL